MTEAIPFLERCVSLPWAIRRGAEERPDHLFIREVEGRELTFAQGDLEARAWAAVLEDLGVGRHDTVASMLLPGAYRATLWAGTGWLHAWDVGINTEYVGRMLAYVLNQCRAKVVVIDPRFVSSVASVAAQIEGLRHIIVVTGGSTSERLPAMNLPESIALHDAAGLLRRAKPVARDRKLPAATDVYGLVYTSGTTGPSKGVLVTWRQLWMLHQGGLPMDALDESDVWYSPFPMYHVAGHALTLMAAQKMGTVVYRERYSSTGYWSDIRRFDCSATILIGAMISFMLGSEPGQAERDHRRLNAIGGPLPADISAFEKRFNIDLWTAYGMSEVSTVFATGMHPVKPAVCGRVRPGFHVRLVDDEGKEVPPGVPGELWVRSDTPAVITSGYFDMPDATAAAWSDGWFMTGDMFRRDAEHNYAFVDRKKDALRRRGENISSREVEIEVEAHPSVLECAAVAVASQHTEDEIKIVVVPKPGSVIDAAGLGAWLEPRMPRFMLPRFIEVLDTLPKTATGKIRKHELRYPPGPTVWDRSR